MNFGRPMPRRPVEKIEEPAKPSHFATIKSFMRSKGGVMGLISMMLVMIVGSLLTLMTNGFWEPILQEGGFLGEAAMRLLALRWWSLPAVILTFAVVCGSSMQYKHAMILGASVASIALIPVHFGAVEDGFSAVSNIL